ncbi:MAG TPA: MFS transporter [Pyrinomonadaceae bacterium]|nr:MFS transporter [Pyrinomonadaceae bacterium]
MSAQALSVNTTETIHGPRVWRVVAFAAIGTTFGWYCFFIFGSLTAPIGPVFFPKGHKVAADLAAIGSFAVVFLVRPLGAILYGRKGDLRGRKQAVVRCSLVLAVTTAAIGLLPAYQTIGLAAPILLITLRVIQGLALGGQHGLVSVYVAELAPETKTGSYLSVIQLTVTAGLLLSSGMIFALQSVTSLSLSGWGWRVLFLLAIVLAAWSLYFHRRMPDSPVVSAAAANIHQLARRKKSIIAAVLIGLFGATAALGVLWYGAQFHTLFFLREMLKVESSAAVAIVNGALALTLPVFVFAGWLTDRFGARKIIMAGCLLAALSFYPAYRGMAATAGNAPSVTIKEMKNPATGGVRVQPVSPQADGTFRILPTAQPNLIALFVLVFSQTLLVAIVSPAVATYLVKSSRADSRCVSVCLSYQLGISLLGAAVPPFTLLLITVTHSIYGGLLYPAVVVLLTFLITLRTPDVLNGSGKN